MATASILFWLVCCAAVVVGSTAWVAVVIARHIRPPAAPQPLGLPDFIVVDCGDQIHFLPVGEAGHVLGSGPCPCQPRKTRNRRRAGGRVLYVDHQTLERHSTVGG